MEAGLMALLVAEPLPLRALGIAAVSFGVLIVESAAASRPAAIAGLVLIALGAVVLDGVRDRRLTTRHAGLFSLMVGGSLALWAALVLAVMTVFDLDPGGHVVVLLSVGGVGTASGIVLLRWPATEEAADRHTGRASTRGRSSVGSHRAA